MEHKFEKYFTEEEWERFKKKTMATGFIGGIDAFFDITKDGDFETFVLGAFACTASDVRYWYEISQRTSPVR